MKAFVKNININKKCSIAQSDKPAYTYMRPRIARRSGFFIEGFITKSASKAFLFAPASSWERIQ